MRIELTLPTSMYPYLRNLLSKTVISLLAASLISTCTQQCDAQIIDTVHNGTTVDTTRQQKPVYAPASRVNSPSVDDSTAFAMRPHPYQPNPKKSGLYSAVLPGLGQAYNHQYWKVPVVYAGLVIAAHYINVNLTQYQTYRKAYISRINNANIIDQFSDLNMTNEQLIPYLKQYQDDYSKYLDLTVLFTGVGYFLQVVDAITSAHLKNFDISRDISMHVTPMAFPNGAGMGLVMNFK